MSLFFAVLLWQATIAQQKKFNVVVLGKTIGHTTVTKKTDEKGFTSYHLANQSSITVMFQNRSSSMTFDIKYFEGKLYSAQCRAMNNGELATTDISKDAHGYLVKKGNETKHITEAATFSSMELYFSEPINEKRVFSERMGEFVAFEKTAPGEYVNKLKDVTNIYRYRNGELYEVEMRKPLGSAYLRAQK